MAFEVTKGKLISALIFGVSLCGCSPAKIDASAPQSFDKARASDIDEQIHPHCLPYQEISEIDLASMRLIIEIPKSRKWNKNLAKVVSGKGIVIPKEYKKRHKARLSYLYSEKKCVSDAKVRISGDYKDHLDLIEGNPISSLDVEILNDTYFGIKSFKLIKRALDSLP